MLNRHAPQVIGATAGSSWYHRTAICHAFLPRTGRAGENQVDDLFAEIMIAIGDEDGCP
jgi:hypothetical protein